MNGIPGALLIIEGMKTQTFKQFLNNFIRCGIAGWCLEVMFTSVDSIMAGDWRLMGTTSLIMFPIYGCGAFLVPISRLVDDYLSDLPGFEEASRDRIGRIPLMIRHGLLYMVLIFIAEYVTGILLTSAGICPWDYSYWPDNVDGVIRLNFAPLWFGTGLIFEQITQNKTPAPIQANHRQSSEI